MATEEEKLNIESEAVLKSLQSRFKVMREFRRMLGYESHRGCALASAAFLDDKLKPLLSACLVKECRPMTA
jgi:hypothetical protein